MDERCIEYRMGRDVRWWDGGGEKGDGIQTGDGWCNAFYLDQATIGKVQLRSEKLPARAFGRLVRRVKLRTQR